MVGNVGAVIAIALFFAVITNRLVECFVVPIFQHNARWNAFWIMPISWIIGFGLSLLFGLRLIGLLVPGGLITVPPLADLILTAILVGGGANLIDDIVSNAPGTTASLGALPIAPPDKPGLAHAVLTQIARKS